ncbi:MAG TPA: long-chain-acyl-CoA synthetase [Stellaceae bacterium]|nr:long-chain-acyl-CoA synthetase [Stellaceae bacterium]
MPDDGSFTAKKPSAANATPGNATQAWIRALSAVKILDQAPTVTLPALLDGLAATHGDAVALTGEGQKFSYRALAARANRVARWAIAQGLAKGEVVALLMPNCPDYVATWLGLTRAGCVVALINTNHVGDALLHSLRVARATHVIVDGSFVPVLAAVADKLTLDSGIWVAGEAASPWPSLEDALAGCDDAPVAAHEIALPNQRDTALLIYTSGTTGAPKAARVTHGRIVEWSFWFAGMMDARAEDRLCDCLPLYHSTGGVVAIGAMLVKGGSVLIRARFSASRFWDDVAEGGCTIFQYIGELCRYLVASKPHPRERDHKLRLACGNGLQREPWLAFAERFAVPQILEFYAATEGSVSLYNCEGKPGAIGRVPPFLAQRFPTALIRCDAETGTPLRNETGRCIPCGPDEIGEAIGRVLDAAATPARQFDGYTDNAASEKKMLGDVLAAGDRWFRNGDLMRKDASGYFYFVDRIGDTFRWKGENVATTEVAAVIRACPGIADAVVYGVKVANHEGRAGMATVIPGESFDIAALWSHLDEALPAYAQPLFLRIVTGIDQTGTFKLTSTKLASEGYAGSEDAVWFNDHAARRFIICDDTLKQAIEKGEKRL